LNFQFFGLTFILSGALSNVIDRLYFGCVIDFIDLKFWPVFNLADVFITTGVILILLDYFRKSKLT
ncbi:MAG: signal peptidase II, partial [Patescibacteria group bacterium]